jgi:hypothetical protein
LCLAGAPFSGKKSIASSLVEKYPGLKIIKIDELLSDSQEAYKLLEELNTEKKDKPTKKEASVEEREAYLKELLDDNEFKELVEKIYSDEQKISDKDIIKLLIIKLKYLEKQSENVVSQQKNKESTSKTGKTGGIGQTDKTLT